MSKALAVSFVDSMSLDQNNASSTDTFYDDVIKDLSQADLFTNVRLIPIAATTEQALSLPGTSGNFASALDADVLDIVGDIDLRCEVAFDDWTPASNQEIISKSVTAGDQRSYRLFLTSSNLLRFRTSVDGIASLTTNSTVATGITDGTRKWVRATLDADNGAAGFDVTFYTSDDGINWTQLGATVTTGGTTSIFNSTAGLEIGSSNGGTSNLSSGKFYRAQVLNGINGTTVFDADFTKQAVSSTSFNEGSNNALVTINQSGSPQAEIVVAKKSSFPSQYTIPDDVVKILEMFYDSSVIPQSTINSLNALNQEWRDLVGRPVAHIVEEETTKQFRLYPSPDINSKDFIFLFGEPLGRDFPEYSVGIVHTEIRDNNPDWLDYIIGLKVVAKEHQKNSDIVDPQFASLCDQLSDLLAGALNA